MGMAQWKPRKLRKEKKRLRDQECESEELVLVEHNVVCYPPAFVNAVAGKGIEWKESECVCVRACVCVGEMRGEVRVERWGRWRDGN